MKRCAALHRFPSPACLLGLRSIRCPSKVQLHEAAHEREQEHSLVDRVGEINIALRYIRTVYLLFRLRILTLFNLNSLTCLGQSAEPLHRFSYRQ